MSPEMTLVYCSIAGCCSSILWLLLCNYAKTNVGLPLLTERAQPRHQIRMESMKRNFVLRAILLVAMIVVPAHTAYAQRDPCGGGPDGAADAFAQSFENETRLGAVRSLERAPEARTILEALPSAADPDTVVAMFAHNQDTHCVYLLTGNDVIAFARTRFGGEDPRQALTSMLEAWRKSVGITDTQPARGLRMTTLGSINSQLEYQGPMNEAAQIKASERLADSLFPGDVRTHLYRFSRMVVLPYAGLGAIPYPALPMDSEGSLFVDQLSVSISPGPTYFAINGRRPRSFLPAYRCRYDTHSSGALVVGDPATQWDTEGHFPPLPGARSEANWVAERLQVTALVGEEASSWNIEEQGARAEIIHIAAHGVALSDQPMQSFLALSDRKWTVRNIQSTCLEGTRLAILSACQSGLGNNHDGGIIGIGRAFILAGVDEVAMTLWSVSDEKTVALMKEFHAALEDRELHTDEALRIAMKETRKIYPEPFVWASFAVLSGLE